MGGPMDLLQELIGESAAIEAVRSQVRRLVRRAVGARHFPPILIQGETGTGKTIVARLIHRLGARASGPFVDVNCPAIPHNLLEAHLFGVERGAFTDAREARPGLFQAAHGGTLFLDEIGDMPVELQTKLLKAIEERTVRRLGSTKSEAVDVWIVAATNADLADLMRQRKFRNDLYHRLAVVNLRLPPLRERPQDILPLAEHFLARACADHSLPAMSFAPDAREALLAHPWEGNIRDLSNAIERVALDSEASVVTAGMLALSDAPAGDLARASSPPVKGSHLRRLADAVGDVERHHVLEALRETAWNISRAAARLGITRNTLRYRIEKHRLVRDGGTVARRSVAAAPPSAAPSPPAPLPSPAAAPSAVRWDRRRLALLRAVVVAPDSASPAPASRAIQMFVEKVRSFGGRVAELSPAGVVAVFGSDVAEDAPRVAAHAALAIQKAAERARRDEPEAVGARLALHFAQALIAEAPDGPQIDLDAKREAWAVLDALVGVGEAGAIVASEAAAPLLGRRFRLQPLDAAATAAGRVCRLVGRERPGLGVGARMARFVGRQDDLQIVQARARAAISGHGHVVGIVGEAGIGKSRLLFELRQSLRREAVTLLRGRCLPYASAVPHFLVLDILRQTLRIAESDGHERIREKVVAALDQLEIDREEAAPYLLQLFGVKEGTEHLDVLSGEALKARILETLRAMIQKGSRQRPIVYVAEDLHWIDKASEDCLAFLVEHLAGLPVLLLTTSRPGYRPPWAEKSYVTQIALQPLTERESLEVVRSVLGDERIPEPLARIILDKAEGNPFFLEELAHVVGERGDNAPAVTVPDTIQQVLLARIERLPEKTRRFLETAAVLGREFSRGLIEAVWDGPAGPHLAELQRFEFLYEGGRGGETTYVFRHALTHEVAYEALLPDDRRALHAAAGRTLEARYPEPPGQINDRLAYHYAQTEESTKAVEYLTRSAERAARSYAHEAAVRALDAAVAHVDRLPAEVRDRRLLDLLLRQASSLFPLGRFQEILDLLLRHEERLERLNDPGVAAHYYFLVGRTYSFLGQDERVIRNAQRAIAEAERCGDEGTMGKAYSLLAMAAAFSGQARQGIEYGRRAIALLEKTDERWWLGDAHWAVGLNHAQTGEFEPALAAEGRAHAIGEAIGDARLQTFAQWVTGIIYACIGEADAAITACQRALERAPDPLNRAIARGLLGFAYLEKGEVARAIPLLEGSVERLGQFRYRPFQGWFSVFLAEAVRQERHVERARDLAMQGLVVTRDANFRTGIGWAQQALGRIAHDRGDFDAAATHLAAALGIFTASHSRYELGRTHLDLAALAHSRQDRKAVAQNLRAAHALFTSLHVPKWVERTTVLARHYGVLPKIAPIPGPRLRR